jgi:hypothetical protein
MKKGLSGIGNGAHAYGVMVAPSQQRLARRRAQGGGVKAVVLEAVRRQPFGSRGMHGAAKGTRCSKADVVEQDDQHIGRALGRAQWLDGRIPVIWILGVVQRYPNRVRVGDGENLPLDFVLGTHFVLLAFDTLGLSAPGLCLGVSPCEP